MTRRIPCSIFLVSLAILVLTACNLRASTAPTQDVSAAYTLAAETIIAQLTAAAPAATLPPPTPMIVEATQQPAATEAIPTETPTLQPSPTDTPTPTETPLPTNTLSPADPRVSLGNPTWKDPFDDGANWPLYADEHVSFEVNDGILTMTALEAELWDGWMLTWPDLSNFYLEMTVATKKACEGADRYGLMFRAVKTGETYAGYQFALSCDGRYFLRKWDGEKYSLLIDWTASDKINKGVKQTNRIGVMTEGKRISLYANGSLLAEYLDETYEKGKFGVLVGAAITAGFQVEVDEISYWDLP